jgi:hypothetical protein
MADEILFFRHGLTQINTVKKSCSVFSRFDRLTVLSEVEGVSSVAIFKNKE